MGRARRSDAYRTDRAHWLGLALALADDSVGGRSLQGRCQLLINQGGVETNMIESYHLRFMQQLGRSYRSFIAAFEAHTGQSMARWRILILLDRWGETSQKLLARELGIDPAALTRQIKEMELEGAVQRRNDAKDARLINVALTEKGRDTVKSTMARRNEYIEWALGDMTESELEAVSDMLLKLEKRLSDRSVPS